MTDMHTARINFEADTKNFERGFDRVTSRLQGLESSINGISQGISNKIGGAIAALAGAVVGSSVLKTYGDFEEAIQNVGIRAGLAKDQMKKLQEFSLKMGADTVFSATEAATSLGELTAAGFTLESAMTALPAVMNAAAASGESLTSVASIMVTTMNSFGLSSKDMTTISDALTKAGLASSASFGEMGAAMSNVGGIAKMFGMNVDETAAALAIFHDAGIKGAEAGTQLKSMLTALGSKESETFLKGIGVSLAYTTKDLQAMATEMGKELPGKWVEGVKLNAGQLLDLEVKAEAARKKIASLEKQASQGKDVDATLTKARQNLASYESQINSGGQATRRFVIDQEALAKSGQPVVGQLKPINTVIKDISKALSGMSEIDRSRAVKEIAGSYGQLGLQALLAAGGLDNMTKKMVEQQSTALIAEKQMGTLKNLLGSLQGSFEALAITVAGPVIEKAIKPLIGGLISVINTLTNLFSGKIRISDVFNSIKSQLDKGWKTLKDSLTPGKYMGKDSKWHWGLHGLFELDLEELYRKALEFLSRVKDTIKKLIKFIWGKIVDFVNGIFFRKTSGGGGGGMLATAGVNPIMGLVQQSIIEGIVKSPIPPVDKEKIKGILGRITKNVVSSMAAILSRNQTLMTALSVGKFVTKNPQIVIAFLREAIFNPDSWQRSQVMGFVSKQIKRIDFTGVGQVLGSLLSRAPDQIKKVVLSDYIKGIRDSIYHFFTVILPRLLAGIILKPFVIFNKIAWLFINALNNREAIGNAIKKAFNWLVNNFNWPAISKLVSDFFTSFFNEVRRIFNDVRVKADELKGVAKGVAAFFSTITREQLGFILDQVFLEPFRSSDNQKRIRMIQKFLIDFFLGALSILGTSFERAVDLAPKLIDFGADTFLFILDIIKGGIARLIQFLSPVFASLKNAVTKKIKSGLNNLIGKMGIGDTRLSSVRLGEKLAGDFNEGLVAGFDKGANSNSISGKIKALVIGVFNKFNNSMLRFSTKTLPRLRVGLMSIVKKFFLDTLPKITEVVADLVSSLVDGSLFSKVKPKKKKNAGILDWLIPTVKEVSAFVAEFILVASVGITKAFLNLQIIVQRSFLALAKSFREIADKSNSPLVKLWLTSIASALESLAKIKVEDIMAIFTAVRLFITLKTTTQMVMITYFFGKLHDILEAWKKGDIVGVIKEASLAIGLLALMNLDKVRLVQNHINNVLMTLGRFGSAAVRSAIGSLERMRSAFASLSQTNVSNLERVTGFVTNMARGLAGMAASMVGAMLVAKALEHFTLAIDALTKGDWNAVISNVVPAVLALAGAFAAFKFGDFITRGKKIKPPLIDKDLQDELTKDLPVFGKRFVASKADLEKLNLPDTRKRIDQILEAVSKQNPKLAKVTPSRYIQKETLTLLKDAAEELKILAPKMEGVPTIDKFQRFKDTVRELGNMDASFATSGLYNTEQINAKIAGIKSTAGMMGDDLKAIIAKLPADADRSALMTSVKGIINDINLLPTDTSKMTPAQLSAISGKISSLGTSLTNLSTMAGFDKLPSSVNLTMLNTAIGSVADFDFDKFAKIKDIGDKRTAINSLLDAAIPMQGLAGTLDLLPTNAETTRFKNAYNDFAVASSYLNNIDWTQPVNALAMNANINQMVTSAQEMGKLPGVISQLPSADATSAMQSAINRVMLLNAPAAGQRMTEAERTKFIEDLRSASSGVQSAMETIGQIPAPPSSNKLAGIGNALRSMSSWVGKGANLIGGIGFGAGMAAAGEGIARAFLAISSGESPTPAVLDAIKGVIAAAAGAIVMKPDVLIGVGRAMWTFFNNLSGIAKITLGAGTIVGAVLTIIQIIQDVGEGRVDTFFGKLGMAFTNFINTILGRQTGTVTTGKLVETLLGPQDKLDEDIKTRMSRVQEGINLAFARLRINGSTEDNVFTNLINQLQLAMAAGIDGFNTEEFSKKFSDALKGIDPSLSPEEASQKLLSALGLSADKLPALAEILKTGLAPKISEMLVGAFGATNAPEITTKVNELIGNAIKNATPEQQAAFMTALTLDFTGMTEAATKGEETLIKFIQDKMNETIGKVVTTEGTVFGGGLAQKVGEEIAAEVGKAPIPEELAKLGFNQDYFIGLIANSFIGKESLGSLTEDQKKSVQGYLSTVYGLIQTEIANAPDPTNLNFANIQQNVATQLSGMLSYTSWDEEQKARLSQAGYEIIDAFFKSVTDSDPLAEGGVAQLGKKLRDGIVEAVKGANTEPVKTSGVSLITETYDVAEPPAEAITATKEALVAPINRAIAATANDPVRLKNKLFVQPEFAPVDTTALDLFRDMNITVDPAAAANAQLAYESISKLEGGIAKLSPASQAFVDKMQLVSNTITVAKDAIVLLSSTLSTSFAAGSLVMVGVEAFKWTFEHIYNYITANYPTLFGPEGTLVTLFSGLFGEDGILTTLVNNLFGQAGIFVGGIEIVKAKLTELETHVVSMIAKMGNAFAPITKLMLIPFADGIIRIGKMLQEAGGADGTGMLSHLSTLGAVLVQSAESIKSMDSGGLGRANTPYLVGAGAQPELVVPNSNASFIPNFDKYIQGAGAPMQPSGSGRQQKAAPVTINVTAEQDFETTLAQVEKAMKRRNREFNVRPT